jgi:hypothetical protein
VSLRQDLISVADSAGWQAALDGLPHSYWHTWQPNHAFHLGTRLPTYLYVCSDPESGARVACPFAERTWESEVDIFTPGGFSGFITTGPTRSAMRAAWADFVKRRGYVCGYFALHPMVADNSLHNSVGSTNFLYLLDLRSGAESALASCDRSVKRALRKWEESGREFVTDRYELAQFLQEHHSEFMRERQAALGAFWPAETLGSMCQHNNVLIAGVRDDAGICAVHTFAVTPFGGECHLNVSVRDGRHYTTALLGWGIEQLCAAKVPWLNMGGGVTPGDSVARSKEKFRPQRVPFTVAREIYDRVRYEELCVAAGQDASSLQGYFPAYRRSPSNPWAPSQPTRISTSTIDSPGTNSSLP